jgi:tRNA dimethylallyltransferase
MDIGTAKPSAAQSADSHHLLDIVVWISISRLIFVEGGKGACGHHSPGKKIIVCGGTGLYIRAFTKGLMDSPAGDAAPVPSLWIRRTEGAPLYRRLSEVDPVSASASICDQPALSARVFQMTGRPFPNWVESTISERYAMTIANRPLH